MLVVFFVPFLSIAFGKITNIYVGDLYLFGLTGLRDFFLAWTAVFTALGIACLIVQTGHKIAGQKEIIALRKEKNGIDEPTERPICPVG